MSVKTNEELEKLKIIGQIVRKTLDTMKAAARSGVTTAELDQIGLRTLTAHGAEAAPPKVYGFPGAVCISVNDEVVHGVPGSRVLQDGDLLKLDLVACKDGFFADSAVTVRIGNVSTTADALVRCAERLLAEAVPDLHLLRNAVDPRDRAADAGAWLGSRAQRQQRRCLQGDAAPSRICRREDRAPFDDRDAVFRTW